MNAKERYRIAAIALNTQYQYEKNNDSMITEEDRKRLNEIARVCFHFCKLAKIQFINKPCVITIKQMKEHNKKVRV